MNTKVPTVILYFFDEIVDLNDDFSVKDYDSYAFNEMDDLITGYLKGLGCFIDVDKETIYGMQALEPDSLDLSLMYFADRLLTVDEKEAITLLLNKLAETAEGCEPSGIEYVENVFTYRDIEAGKKVECWDCQSALNFDPLSASNIDPPFGTVEVVPVVHRGDPRGFV